jgi:hypothetical protein
MELQYFGPLSKDPALEYMLLQAVRFAFRMHQVTHNVAVKYSPQAKPYLSRNDLGQLHCNNCISSRISIPHIYFHNYFWWSRLPGLRRRPLRGRGAGRGLPERSHALLATGPPAGPQNLFPSVLISKKTVVYKFVHTFQNCTSSKLQGCFRSLPEVSTQRPWMHSKS